MFSILRKTNFNFSLTFILSSANNAFNLDKSKNSLLGTELICTLDLRTVGPWLDPQLGQFLSEDG